MLEMQLLERKPQLQLFLRSLPRIHLGITDAEVESVFRTTAGFTTPWAKWQSGHPNDALASGVEDCGGRHPSNGLWTDINCGGNYAFYCEGEKTV